MAEHVSDMATRSRIVNPGLAAYFPDIGRSKPDRCTNGFGLVDR
jgi:hypothetical protein